MRRWISLALGTSLVSMVSACTLVPNPALKGDEGTSTGEAGTTTADPGTSTGAPDEPPPAPVLELSYSPIKRFDFGWADVPEASVYQLLERSAPAEPWVQLGGDLAAGDVAVSWEVPLYERQHASYRLRACNTGGCTDSAEVAVSGSLAEAVGYVKAANTDAADGFARIALSGDGNTLAVGASGEDSSATGIDGDPSDDSAMDAGSVYVLVRDGAGAWSQQAYVKASNPDAADAFGFYVALSEDGNTLAVAAWREDSGASGIDGDQTDDSAMDSGAVYVFVRDGAGTWSQQAYIKASNNDAGDRFGSALALSDDGNTLAVGAQNEDGSATGIDGDQLDDSATNAGAVYVFVRDGMGAWSQQAYVKASNTGADDQFGFFVALGDGGSTLAVGAPLEGSGATGIDGDALDDSAIAAGATYVFVRDGAGTWSQQAYVKASNTDSNDQFGFTVALASDGDTLAVGAPSEDGGASGIDGDQADDSAANAGAVYVLARDDAGAWSQQAYVKASNVQADDLFGYDVRLSADGSTLAVGAPNEDGSATGIDGDQADGSAPDAGAVYVFVRDETSTWSQTAYVKAPNAEEGDFFSLGLALSSSGDTLAVGASSEDSSATGIGGDQTNDSASAAGAVYLY